MIVGIDPCAGKNLGWCLMEDERVLETGVFHPNPEGYLYLGIYFFIDQLIKEKKPDAVVMERSIGFGFAPLREVITEITGIIKICCQINKVPYEAVNTNQAASKVIGKIKKGQKKKETIRWVKENYNLDVVEHVADAILMAEFYRRFGTKKND